MKKRVWLFCIFISGLVCTSCALAQEEANPVSKVLLEQDTLEMEPDFSYVVPLQQPHIIVDQNGYQSADKKIAFFYGNNLEETFEIRDEKTDEVVYSGTLRQVKEADGKMIYTGAFTDFAGAGKYYIHQKQVGDSHTFTTGASIYNRKYKEMENLLLKEKPDELAQRKAEGEKLSVLMERVEDITKERLPRWETKKKLLAQKLENVEPEKIVEPEAYVAIPALQAISYSMNSEELRNLYANLLAKSMNVDTKDSVHPSFVEIIKQMSPNDALIFKTIYEAHLKPLIDLYISLPNGKGEDYHIYNISWFTSYSPTIIRITLDNLLRLGLIEIPSGKYYANDTAYSIIRSTNHYSEAQNKLIAYRIGKIQENKKYIKCTELATSFYNICIND